MLSLPHDKVNGYNYDPLAEIMTRVPFLIPTLPMPLN